MRNIVLKYAVKAVFNGEEEILNCIFNVLEMEKYDKTINEMIIEECEDKDIVIFICLNTPKLLEQKIYM